MSWRTAGIVAALLVVGAGVIAGVLWERGDDMPRGTSSKGSPPPRLIESFEVEVESPSTATAVYELARPARLSVEIRGTGPPPNPTALVGVGRTPGSPSSGPRRPAEAGNGSEPFPLRYGEINFRGERRLHFRLRAVEPEGSSDRSEWVVKAVEPGPE